MPNSQAKVLIADDMKTMRVLLRKRLADLGITEVVEAADGEVAWQEIEKALAENRPFDLIISDWLMPKLKGIHLLQRVRSNSKLKAVPFVMLTAENEADSVKEAVAAGVTSYLVKPFTPEAFSEKVKAALAASPAKRVA